MVSLKISLITILILCVSSVDLFACGFHNYIPEKTIVDRLLDSRRVVVARPDADDPFRYKVISYLMGNTGPVEINDLVDSTTRRKLLANPKDAVLFVMSERDRSWQRLVYLDDSFSKIIKTVLDNFEEWKSGFHHDRFRVFSNFYDHPNIALKELALLELDQAPYKLLRTLKLRINAEVLISELWSFRGLPFIQIRILLLGLTNSDTARLEIRKYLARAAFENRWNKSLGAFATALVEIDGASGLERLETYYFKNLNQPLDKLELVVEALAIHSQVGHDELKKSIKSKLENLVNVRPEAAALIARQFGKRKVWTQKNYLRTLLAEKIIQSQDERSLIENYIREAENS